MNLTFDDEQFSNTTKDGGAEWTEASWHEVVFGVIFLTIYSSSVLLLLAYTMRRNRRYKTIEKQESNIFYHYITQAKKQADRDAVELTKLRLPHLFQGYKTAPGNDFGVSFNVFDNKRLVKTIEEDRAPKSGGVSALLASDSTPSCSFSSPTASPARTTSPPRPPSPFSMTPPILSTETSPLAFPSPSPSTSPTKSPRKLTSISPPTTPPTSRWAIIPPTALTTIDEEGNSRVLHGRKHERSEKSKSDLNENVSSKCFNAGDTFGARSGAHVEPGEDCRLLDSDEEIAAGEQASFDKERHNFVKRNRNANRSER